MKENLRPVNLPPEFTKMKHYSEKGGHKARGEHKRTQEKVDKAFNNEVIYEPEKKSRKKRIIYESRKGKKG